MAFLQDRVAIDASRSHELKKAAVARDRSPARADPEPRASGSPIHVYVEQTCSGPL